MNIRSSSQKVWYYCTLHCNVVIVMTIIKLLPVVRIARMVFALTRMGVVSAIRAINDRSLRLVHVSLAAVFL